MKHPTLVATVTAALVALSTIPAVAQEQPLASLAPTSAFNAIYIAGDQPLLEKAQYIYGGRHYCWYDLGWRGPGFYWCGYGARRGYGWGGGVGWHGWSHGGYRGGYRHGYHGGYRGGYHGSGYAHRGGYHGGGHYGGGGHGGYHGGHGTYGGGSHGGGHGGGPHR